MGVAGALMLGGAGMQVMGQMREGAAAEASANFNAAQYEQQAREVEKKTFEDVRRFRIARRKDQASNRAAVAASGITMSGSALEIIRENARNAAADEIQMKLEGRRRADEARANARFARMSARNARKSAEIGAAATLLSAGGQAYTNYGGGS